MTKSVCCIVGCKRLCIARQLLKAEPQAYRSCYRIENLFGRIKAHELERLLPWA